MTHPDTSLFTPDAIAETASWLNLGHDATRSLVESAHRAAADESRASRLRCLYLAWIVPGPGAIEDAMQWPRTTDAEVLETYALLCVGAVPHSRRQLESRGLPPTIVRAAFNDVGRRLETCHRLHGVCGIENPRWLGRHLHGRLVELGRLQYERGLLSDKIVKAPRVPLGEALAARGLSLADPVWWVHIPADEPLTPEACGESLAQAEEGLPRWFPDHPARVFACCSWMLDPQLRRYLPADTNLLRFADRFEVVIAWADDAEFAQFVRRSSLSRPTLTRLQQADETHRSGGGTWRNALGVVAISA